MTPSNRKARLREFVAAVWDNGDLSRVDEYVAPAYHIRHDPGDPWHGQVLDHAAFANRVAQSRAAFPDQKFTFEGLFEDGDTVVMTWTWLATQQGDVGPFRATGRPIAMSGATAYGFDAEDRLTGHWQIVDRLSVFQQLQGNAQG